MKKPTPGDDMTPPDSDTKVDKLFSFPDFPQTVATKSWKPCLDYFRHTSGYAWGPKDPKDLKAGARFHDSMAGKSSMAASMSFEKLHFKWYVDPITVRRLF